MGDQLSPTPPFNMRFEPGDTLIALGTKGQLKALQTLTNFEP
jgi:K+/H+ antiporter YhaU regulatory subunit KhtT